MSWTLVVIYVTAAGFDQRERRQDFISRAQCVYAMEVVKREFALDKHYRLTRAFCEPGGRQ